MRKMMIGPMLLAGLLFSAAFSPAAIAQDAPQRIEITAKRFTYDPGEITLKKGQPVVLVLKSADVAHGLRISELKVDVQLHARGTQEVQITPQKTGNFVGHCSVFCGPGHANMALKVHVVN
jgi:cytochrome c oxidase subunit 2